MKIRQRIKTAWNVLFDNKNYQRKISFEIEKAKEETERACLADATEKLEMLQKEYLSNGIVSRYFVQKNEVILNVDMKPPINNPYSYTDIKERKIKKNIFHAQADFMDRALTPILKTEAAHRIAKKLIDEGFLQAKFNEDMQTIDFFIYTF